MDTPDLYSLFDLDGAFNLQSEGDAFLQTPETTTSPVAHPDRTPEQEAIPQQRQRRFAPRSRQGCLTCRARRKRCDAHRPVCRTCTRLNAECRWPDKLQISGSSSAAKPPRSQDAATTARSDLELGLFNSLAGNVDVGWTADAYPSASTTTHGITVVQSSSNFFTSLYIPMAFHCTGVMDAIIACAAAHLAKSVREPEKSRELSSVAIQRQQRAREFITEHTERPERSESGEFTLEVVVVLLLLIGLETQAGGRGLRWMQRVNCVRQLLQTYPTTAAKKWSAWEMDCVHRHFLYHDVMALIMEDVLDPDTRAHLSNRSGPFRDCAATLSAPQTQDLLGRAVVATPVTPLEFLQGENVAQGVDCLLGLSRGLFGIITQLRDLPSRDSQLIGMDAPEFLKLEADLSNWQYDDEMASTIDLNTRLDLIALAECHRLAALILLYRRYSSRSYCLPHIASKIMCTVSRITPTSAVVSVLTPVLFLAGAELNSEVDMTLCAAKLKSMREASKMMNIVSVEEVLRVVWKERLQNRIQTDWLEILRARRWTFSLG
ncbi:fungal-specific transcription factor domain-containing protein [Trichoderma asperelloides]|nr:fungal-specific transcription factor domain-containing protein [Trichoderma asperelloides]